MQFIQVGRISSSIPKGLTWFTLAISIVPFLLIIAGVHIGLGGDVHSSGNIIHARFLHIALDAFAVAIAFLTAILGFIHFSSKGDVVAPIVGVALFCAAIPDIGHILGSASVLPVRDDEPANMIAYSWIFSRSFHALVLIMGTGIFLLRSSRLKEYNPSAERSFVYRITIFFFVLTAVGILLLLFTREIPQVIYPGRMIPRPYDFVLLIVYLLAGIFILPAFCIRFPSVFSQTVLLSIVPAIATQLHMAFGSYALLDDNFFAAHILKCVSYFIPFLGLGLSYYQSQLNEVETMERLRREEKEKKLTSETLKGVLNSSLSGIQVFRAVRNSERKIIDFECLLMNPAAELIEGKTSKEVVGKRLLEVYPWTKEGYIERYAEVVESGRSLNYEYFSGQHKKWLHSMAVKLEDGFAITYSDITQRKNAEEALIQGKKKFETVFNQTFQFIHVLTPEGIVVDVNGTALKFSGRKQEEVIGKMFWELPEWRAHKNAESVLSEMINRAAAGELMRHEAPVKSVSAKVITIDLSIKPVKSDSGDIILLLAEGRDITGQKKAAEQIRNYQEELEMRIEELNRSNQELEQFAYVASHDLQEPLRKVRAFGDRLVLKYKDALGDEGRNYIERMENAATRMQVLIDNLLNFSRLSRSKEPYIKVNLEELVKSVLSDLEISIEQKKAHIVINELPVIDAIPSQMRQLFQNLLSNALKFSSKEKEPVIILGSEQFTDEYGEEMSRIRVIDNGIGFDEKYADRIFNIFQRLHGRNEYEGTGIGLAVCKKIAENHGGSITAESEPGEGSTFVITLPLEHPENQVK
jgi:PAS domain S-box-containing protein